MISPESQGGPDIALITIACGWTFVGVALLGVSLLIWSRRLKKIGLGLDGYLTIFALVTTIGLVAQTTWAIAVEGQDDHEAEVKSTRFALVSLLVNQTLWGLVNTLIRMSAILFIERIFGIAWVMKWITRSLLVLSILYGLVVFLEVFLICRPMAVDWNAHKNGTCGDQIVSYLVLEILGHVIDFTILVVPLPYIWRLQIRWPRKLSIAALFSIGALVFIVTGLRIQALRMVNAQDFTYSNGYLAVPAVYQQWRAKFLERASMATHINEMSLPMTEDHHSTDIPSQPFYAWLKSGSRAVHVDEENLTTASETPDEISLPTTVDSATQTHGRNAR